MGSDCFHNPTLKRNRKKPDPKIYVVSLGPSHGNGLQGLSGIYKPFEMFRNDTICPSISVSFYVRTLYALWRNNDTSATHTETANQLPIPYVFDARELVMTRSSRTQSHPNE
jgi:hypothetical protein